jgi:hypothetical protein
MTALVINLFAGPGAGKSTAAAGVFRNLKKMGINAEFVPEYAKDLTWESRDVALDNQIYVLGKQYHRLFRVMNQVDVIITDSPLIFGAIYAPEPYFTHFTPLVIEVFKSMRRMSYFIDRQKPYNPSGRSQTEAEAIEVDLAIRRFLRVNEIAFKMVPGNDDGEDIITNEVLEVLDLDEIKRVAGV